MADELKVIITADASGVAPAVEQATAAVKASADQIAAAQAKLKASTEELAGVQQLANQVVMQVRECPRRGN